MNKIKLIVLILSISCAFLLTMWGFQGKLPSWMGGLAWLLLLLDHVLDLIKLTMGKEDSWTQLAKELKENMEKLRSGK